MPRKPRIFYPGAIFHVMARGNNKKDIFHDPKDFLKYQLICKDCLTSMDYSILAYAFMPNHNHILAEVHDTPLTAFMKIVQQRYTQYYNRKYQTSGHVFQGRYKALLVDKERYLLSLVRYINRNAFEAGLESNLGQFPWTGHYEILHGKPVLINFPKLLSYIDDNQEIAREKYLKLIGDRGLTTIPDEAYLDTADDKDSKISGHTQRLFESIDEVLEIISRALGVDEGKIFLNTRKRDIVIARNVFVYLVKENTLLTGAQLAILMNVSQEHIARIYQRALHNKYDIELRTAIEKVMNLKRSIDQT